MRVINRYMPYLSTRSDLVIGIYFSLFILGDDALVQVYPEGIRHIRADKRVNEWKAPGKKTVMNCAVNRRQVVIALSGGELVYFEMDPVSLKQDLFPIFLWKHLSHNCFLLPFFRVDS